MVCRFGGVGVTVRFAVWLWLVVAELGLLPSFRSGAFMSLCCGGRALSCGLVCVCFCGLGC